MNAIAGEKSLERARLIGQWLREEKLYMNRRDNYKQNPQVMGTSEEDTEYMNVHRSGCTGVKLSFRENQETEDEKKVQHAQAQCFVVSVYNITMMHLYFLF